MRNHTYRLKSGITRSKEFEKKGLACFSINPGTKCGHDCLYCSTGAMLRMHPSFRAVWEDPFGHGFSIVDPTIVERVARDAQRIQERGLIQLCTTVDAWAPEAQHLNLGRRILEAVLPNPGWTVRILTKNAAVRNDFDLIEKYRDRVLVGLSITTTPDKEAIINILEPNASPIRDRMAAMSEAKARGLRTYAMFCPLFPKVSDSPEQLDQLVTAAVSWGAEEIFVEPVNQRGRGLEECQEALEYQGFLAEATAVNDIRKVAQWSHYVAQLVATVQQSVRKHSEVKKLRFLLYSDRLLVQALDKIRDDDEGIIWLWKRWFPYDAL
jgi:DNA repair photolyase